MLSRGEYDRFLAALDATVNLSVRDFDRFWALLDLSRPDSARDALLEVVPALTDKYGQVAAVAAAEYYETLREQEITDTFLATPADSVNAEQVESSVRYSAQHLYEGQPDLMKAYLYGTLDKFVKQPARDTMIQNSLKDKGRPKFARVPRGAETCKFCVMLASRGFVYATAESAGGFNKWHAHCDCEIVPGWGTNPQVEGYDPDEYYRMYLEDDFSRGGHREPDPVPAITERQQEIKDKLKEKGFRWDKELQRLDERAVYENAVQLNTLLEHYPKAAEYAKYNIAQLSTGSFQEGVAGATGANYTFQSQRIALARGWYSDYDALVRRHRAMSLTPAHPNASAEYYALTTLNHEFGHYIENTMLRQKYLGDDGFKEKIDRILKISDPKKQAAQHEAAFLAEAKGIRRDIVEIAKELKPGFRIVADVPTYGRQDAFEFFAVAFEDLSSGKPSILGRAMEEYLRRKGYTR